jgi:hypothetical protein
LLLALLHKLRREWLPNVQVANVGNPQLVLENLLSFDAVVHKVGVVGGGLKRLHLNFLNNLLTHF